MGISLDHYRKQYLQPLIDADESIDGIAVDAVFGLLKVEGEEMTDGEMMDELISIIELWHSKTNNQASGESK